LQLNVTEMLINFNGKVVPADQPVLSAKNRSFHFGDGLFESIRVFEGKMPFFPRHWNRMRLGFERLKFEIPAYFTESLLVNEIQKLTEGKGNWRIRLTVWRSGGGRYTPEGNLPAFLIEAEMLDSNQFELNQSGLIVGVFQQFRLPLATSKPSIIQGFKTTSALHYVLASIYKKEEGLDECLLLNSGERIVCGSSSNIFVVKNNELITPPTSDGCIKGTMRGNLLEACKRLNFKVLTVPITMENLKNADEVILTNAISGIQWIWQVQGLAKNFGYAVALDLLDELNLMVREQA